MLPHYFNEIILMDLMNRNNQVPTWLPKTHLCQGARNFKDLLPGEVSRYPVILGILGICLLN